MFHIKDIEISKEGKEYLQRYLKTAPDALLRRIKIEKIPKPIPR